MHDPLPFHNRIARSLDRRLGHWCARNDALSRVYERASLALSPSVRRQPLVLFQMGRVGSRTIEESLIRCLDDVRVHHVHFLTESGQERFNRPYIGNPYYRGRGQRYVVRNRFLARQIRSTLHREQWRVVTAVRDPLARNVSMFFTMLLARWPHTRAKERVRAGECDEIVRDLLPIFMEEFDHETALSWFDDEMKAVFELDVYAEPFDVARGYQIYDQGNTQTLLIRLENLRENSAEAFSRFLGISDFTLIESNIGAQKDYGRVYKRFLELLELPDSYIERMYTSRFARHFYSDRQLDAFREKWTSKRVTCSNRA
jgi:hypothetical protein